MASLTGSGSVTPPAPGGIAPTLTANPTGASGAPGR